MTPEARSIRHRFLLLRALRWLPSGLIGPVFILLMTERGFSLSAIGAAVAMQGLVLLVLELPTGGLADALGRRPVLLGATVIEAASVTVFAFAAHSLLVLMLVWALQGVYRALESGPLDAWYVDAALTADPDADIEHGLSLGGVVLGVAIAAGFLVSSALVTLAPFPGVHPLVGPLLVAIALRGVEVAALARLMTEVRPRVGLVALRRSIHEVPQVVATAVGLVRRSRVLLALVTVELFWGFGMVTWETLLPPHLGEATGNADTAAALLGPAGAAAWVGSAAAAALITHVTRRFGAAVTAATMRVLQALTVVGMALAAGPVGVLAWYLATYAIHGAANPVHQGLLHRQVSAAHRTTILSVNSLMGMPAASLGAIVLGSLADATNTSTAMVVGAAVLALAAPLYLVARSGARDTHRLPGADATDGLGQSIDTERGSVGGV